jgi:hypothetical protein
MEEPTMVPASLCTAGFAQRFSRACIPTLAVLLGALAGPCLAATITVTGTGDTIASDGVVTLREAITSINNQADVNADVTGSRAGGYGSSDTINFNIAGGGVKTISPTTGEPTIIRPLTIDGYTQGVASSNTLANADNAVLQIELDGTGAGASVDGLTLGAGSGGSTIRGLVINRFSGNGIVVQSNGNSIFGNFVGVDPTGTSRMPNGTFPNSGDGILILSSSNNLIGSTAVADRNVASGNAIYGIHIVGTIAAPATGNLIQGNFVGVAADGKSSVGNRTEPAPAPGAAEGNNLGGIQISGGNLNTVGGTVAGARNVVGFNGIGIEVANGGQQNIIRGNFSGVGADGVTPTGNLLQGIVLRSSNGFAPPLGPAQPGEPGVSFNIIGGTAAGAGNLVEFNGRAGVSVFGNTVSASGQPNVGNAILGNSLFENGRSNPTLELGIDLTNQFTYPRDDGVTPNDSQGHGAANDPNNFQNFPVLTSASPNGGNTDITGTLMMSTAPNSTFRIEFFANDSDPANAAPEGQQFLGFVNATTDAGGAASFSPSFGVAVAPGRIVTATATDGTGSTSEFSAGTVVAGPATHFTVSAPASATAGTAFSFTVAALDALNNTATSYTGTAHFTSSDGASVLPANATLTNGVGTFSATLKTAGSQTITATDTVTSSITGTSNAIAVSAAAATHFTVSAPASATAGTAFNFTVTAADQFNNTATSYAGTVHFSSSDGASVLPANATLTNGVGTFSATLKTAGSQTITGTDTVTSAITGTSTPILVAPNNVFSGPSATGTGTITATFTGGGATCGFSAAQYIGAPPGAPPVPPTLPSGPTTFPQGMFNFSLAGCTPGSTITMTITYPNSIAGAQYWKYGPEAANHTAHWYVMPATISGNTASFSITDGGQGDDDFTPNGVIADPGGPGLAAVAVTPAAIPTLSQWMLALLAFAMLGIAAQYYPGRRQ